MGSYKIVEGNLLDATENLICHQVNCMNVMGSGVAKAIYEKWPQVKIYYHSLCNEVKNPDWLIGHIQLIPINENQSVVNIFGQLNYGRNKNVIYTRYSEFEVAIKMLRKNSEGKTIAFPYGIGCGLANGDWNTIEGIIKDVLKDRDVTIYKYNNGGI